MKRFCLLPVILFVLINGCNKTDNVINTKPSEWHVIYSQPNAGFNSLYFTGHDTGYAVGSVIDNEGVFFHGIINKATDGGQHWNYLASGTNCQLYSIYSTDNQTGYTVGYWNEENDLHGIILKTTDGGSNWDSIPYPGQVLLSSVTFTTADVGYALGANSILKTTDAGHIWETIFTYPYRGLTSFSFIKNSPSGFVVGQDGTILKTVDAGVTWTDLSDHKFSTLWSVF